MNTLTRWEPFREMEDVQNRLSTLFGRTPVRRGNGKESITLPEWTPLADITEDDREYVIKAELPELRREDVKVTVENGVLTHLGRTQVRKRREKEEVSPRRARLRQLCANFRAAGGRGRE
jgi:HSP20 family protein